MKEYKKDPHVSAVEISQLDNEGCRVTQLSNIPHAEVKVCHCPPVFLEQ